MKRKYSLKLIMKNFLNENKVDAAYDVESSEYQNYQSSTGEEHIIIDSDNKKVGTLEHVKSSEKEGTFKDKESERLYDYSYELIKATSESGDSYISQGLRLTLVGGPKSEGMQGNYVDFYRDNEGKNKVFLKRKNEKKILILPDFVGKEKKEFKMFLDSELGLGKQGYKQLIQHLVAKKVKGAKELEKETKKLNESLSRGSLYRRRYSRY